MCGVRVLTISLLMSFLLSACGDPAVTESPDNDTSGTDSNVGVTTGVDFAGDDSRLMSDLTAEEWEVYCQQATDAMNAELSALDICMLQALGMAEAGRGSCEQIYESCLADEPPPQTIDADCDDFELATCQATLAQVESCANDLVEGMKAFVAPALDADCSTDTSGFGDGGPPDPPCVFEIDAICPGFGPSDI